MPWSSSTVKRKLGLLICEEGKSDVCQSARARKMMDLTQIWKGGLKTKESPQQSQARERSEEEGPGALGGTRVADGRQSPQPTCGRQMWALPGPGC